MSSMYEKIMQLPLFHGISKEQVSSFLEKTTIEFINYEDGEQIIEEGNFVESIVFVMSGHIRITHSLPHFNISIEETAGEGRVLGAENLFGMSTRYPFSANAEGKTSVMCFSKKQYISLLETDPIYRLNFFNYLSIRAQKPLGILINNSKPDIYSRLKTISETLSSSYSKTLTIKADDNSIAEYCGVTPNDVTTWKTLATSNGLIHSKDNTITLL